MVCLLAEEEMAISPALGSMIPGPLGLEKMYRGLHVFTSVTGSHSWSQHHAKPENAFGSQ